MNTKKMFDCSGKLKYGFEKLDELTGGLSAGEFVVLGSRPAVGKTSFALNITANAVQQIKKAYHEKSQRPGIFYFSLEMTAMEIFARMPAEEPRSDLKTIESYPIYLELNGYSKLTAEDVKVQARKVQEKTGLVMIVIDYIQLMTGEINSISRELKAIAKEMAVPVIALSQLSRELEKRPGKRPMLSDLRDSKSLGQDADTVLLLNGLEDGSVDIIVAKTRNGVTGSINMVFNRDACKFSERGKQ